jgi:small subunit ribosomal protein S6
MVFFLSITAPLDANMLKAQISESSMIYEVAILAHADLDDERLNGVKSIINSVVKENDGEVLIGDDWGVRTLAQPTESGIKRAQYLYFMYKSKGTANIEIQRRLGLSEEVVRSMVILLGEDRFQEKFVKAHKSPFGKN